MSDFADNFKAAILEYVQEDEPDIDSVVGFYEHTTPAGDTLGAYTEVIVKCLRDGEPWNHHFFGDLSEFLSAVLVGVE